jgi:hypothetical protein
VKHLLKSVVREIRTLRSVGTGGGQLPPVTRSRGCDPPRHSSRDLDATFIDAPRQRNTREENETIKSGNVPEEWKNQPNMLAQKDLEAEWAKKNDETHYGYKDHANVDVCISLFEIRVLMLCSASELSESAISLFFSASGMIAVPLMSFQQMIHPNE